MALSGDLGNTFRTGYRIQIEWTATQNVTNNTSTITARFYLISQGSGYNIVAPAAASQSTTIDGVTTSHSVNVSVNGNQKKLLSTTTRTITHNSNGTRSFAIGGNVNLNVTLSGVYWGVVTIPSQTFTLDTIPRSTTPTLNVSTQAMGSSITITTSRASSAFTHTLKYSFGSASATIATGVETSTSWTLPSSLASQIPNSTSGSGSIICETYNGSTLVGTRTVGFTATVPNNATYNPTVSIALSGNNLRSGNYVQGRSTVTITLTAASKFSGTITSRSTTVRAGSTTISSSTANSFTSGALTSSGTITVATTVTDSRGRTATASSTFTVQIYSAPMISAFTAFRANSNGTANPSGTHIRVTGTALISPINNSNSRSTLIRRRVSGTTTWTTVTSNTVSYTPSLASTFAANVNTSYEVEIVSTDAYNTVTRRINVGTAFTLMNMNSSGQGIAFGKVSESNTFEVGMKSEINGEAAWNLYDPRVYMRPAVVPSGGYARGIHFRDNSDYTYASMGFYGTDGGISYAFFGKDYNGAKNIRVYDDARDPTVGTKDICVVEESGSNSNGYYVRYSDGTQICWGEKSESPAITTGWSANWFYSPTFSVTFPINFYLPPTFNATWMTSSAHWAVIITPTVYSTSARYVFLRPSSQAAVSGTTRWMAVGRWKS